MDFTDVSAWYTVGDVARRLGLCEDRVRELIRDKKIRASKIGKWLVHPQDLVRFIESRMNIQERKCPCNPVTLKQRERI